MRATPPTPSPIPVPQPLAAGRPPGPAEADRGPGPSTAAGRTLAVLAAFDQEHSALSLSEISRRTRLSLTTTHRALGAPSVATTDPRAVRRTTQPDLP